MTSNLEKYKKDLDRLIKKGDDLHLAIQAEFLTEELKTHLKEELKNKKEVDEFLKNLLSFMSEYQSWYSEALVLLRQLLPDRVLDFIRLYEKSKNRKNITYENYVIEDALHNLVVTQGWEKKKVVGPEAAISRFRQQLSIVKSIKERFESSLFDIKQLVQADIFDSELEAAEELNGKGFTRAAGAVAGVVLEGHLLQVCNNHKMVVAKKNPSINDLAQLLKDNKVIDTPDWRKIQHLADLRNLCDHKKKTEPNKTDIDELISGVSKITKNLF